MKKNLITINFTVVIYLLLWIFLYGCLPKSLKDWHATERQNTIDSYKNFLNMHPDDKLAEKAKEKIYILQQKDMWKTAKSNDLFNDYVHFLRRYPDSPYTDEATARMRESFIHEYEVEVRNNWEKASKIDTIDSYEEFLTNNPGSKFIPDCRKRFEEIGKDPDLNAILDRNLEKIKKQKNRSTYHPFLVYPVLSNDNKWRLVFKNKDFRYYEITTFGVRKLPIDYELIKLRLNKPYMAGVLYIGEYKKNSNINSFPKDFEKIFSHYFNVLEENLKYSKYKYNMPMFFPIEPPKERIKKVESWGDRFVLTARLGKDYDRILEVNENLSFTEKTEYGGNLLIYSLIDYLSVDSKENRKKAESMLIRIGKPSVPAIIKELNNNSHQKTYINILTELGDTRAIPALVDLLFDWDYGPQARSSLNQFYWTPATQTEKVYDAVARRDESFLLDDWQVTKKILIKEFASNNIRKMQCALYTFISIGDKEVISELINVLNRIGDAIMAETFMNCGNKQLSDAGELWLHGHGYGIYKGPGANKARWGRFTK